MSTDPNWRQFAREVIWSAGVSAACCLLGVTIPPEGRPRRFRCPGVLIERSSDAEPFTCWRRGPADLGISQQVATGEDVLAFLAPFSSAGIHGQALGEWLAMWGWSPPPRKAMAAPPPPPPIL